MDYAQVMPWVLLVGRILYGGFFVLGGINHFQHLGMMSGYSGSKGVPAAKALVVLSGLLILVGGALVILGFHAGIGLVCIVVFLVPVSLMMHNYWTIADPMQKLGERVNFQKNVALLGAALMLLALPRPWPFSLML